MSSLLALVYTNDLFTAYVFVEINTLSACAVVMAKEVDIDSCPNCHGKITKKGKSVKCEYCDSVINRKPTNLVLVDKKMVRQSVK